MPGKIKNENLITILSQNDIRKLYPEKQGGAAAKNIAIDISTEDLREEFIKKAKAKIAEQKKKFEEMRISISAKAGSAAAASDVSLSYDEAQLSLKLMIILGVGAQDLSSAAASASDTKEGYREFALSLITVLENMGADELPSEASLLLGICYEDGAAVAKDEEKEKGWYMAAAKKGHVKAQYAIGDYYKKHGDKGEALTWYLKSAKQGFAPAQYELGVALCSEEALETLNVSQGIKFLSLAAAQEHVPAKAALEEILRIAARSQVAPSVEMPAAAAPSISSSQAHALQSAAWSAAQADAAMLSDVIVKNLDLIYILSQNDIKKLYGAEKGGGDGKGATLNISTKKLKEEFITKARKKITEEMEKFIISKKKDGAAATMQISDDLQLSLKLMIILGVGNTLDAHQSAAATEWDKFNGFATDLVKEIKTGGLPGLCYGTGTGFARDLKELEKYCLKDESPLSKFVLGLLYEGIIDNAYSYPEAVVESYRSAEGYAPAQNRLGLCYEAMSSVQGHGAVRILKLMILLFTHAADQGYAIAQNNLGRCYQGGIGVKRDLMSAAKWYKKAADQGNAEAQFNLGLLYEKGEGVDKDYNSAKKYYELAAYQGNADAKFAAGRCYQFGADQNIAKAIAYFVNAAKQGNKDAILALINFVAIEVKHDEHPMANIDLFVSAVISGNADATTMLMRAAQTLTKKHTLTKSAATPTATSALTTSQGKPSEVAGSARKAANKRSRHKKGAGGGAVVAPESTMPEAIPALKAETSMPEAIPAPVAQAVEKPVELTASSVDSGISESVEEESPPAEVSELGAASSSTTESEASLATAEPAVMPSPESPPAEVSESGATLKTTQQDSLPSAAALITPAIEPDTTSETLTTKAADAVEKQPGAIASEPTATRSDDDANLIKKLKEKLLRAETNLELHKESAKREVQNLRKKIEKLAKIAELKDRQKSDGDKLFASLEADKAAATRQTEALMKKKTKTDAYLNGLKQENSDITRQLEVSENERKEQAAQITRLQQELKDVKVAAEARAANAETTALQSKKDLEAVRKRLGEESAEAILQRSRADSAEARAAEVEQSKKDLTDRAAAAATRVAMVDATTTTTTAATALAMPPQSYLLTTQTQQMAFHQAPQQQHYPQTMPGTVLAPHQQSQSLQLAAQPQNLQECLCVLRDAIQTDNFATKSTSLRAAFGFINSALKEKNTTRDNDPAKQALYRLLFDCEIYSAKINIDNGLYDIANHCLEELEGRCRSDKWKLAPHKDDETRLSSLDSINSGWHSVDQVLSITRSTLLESISGYLKERPQQQTSYKGM
jgi:TPR repeat protein